jgi:CHAT domain-containing protein
VLRAAAGGEDGLLQIREIVDLRLGGRAVVLASCRSASGTLLRGEGVMGLARAFFQAGSHAVVASLWPLRDDEAAQLFDRFYEHLGRGDSLAAALQAAQRDLIAAKAPAAAWAGLEVLGDGDLVPLPGGRKFPYISPAERAVALAVLALLAAAAAALLAYRRRSRTAALPLPPPAPPAVPPEGAPVTPGSR